MKLSTRHTNRAMVDSLGSRSFPPPRASPRFPPRPPRPFRPTETPGVRTPPPAPTIPPSSESVTDVGALDFDTEVSALASHASFTTWKDTLKLALPSGPIKKPPSPASPPPPSRSTSPPSAANTAMGMKSFHPREVLSPPEASEAKRP